MKSKYVLYIFLLTAIVGCNKGPLPDVPQQFNHYDHQIFEENKLPPRATFYTSESKEVTGKDYSRRYMNLNGEWKFLFVRDPKELPKIPRIGMYLTLPKSFANVAWYGKGPEETYWDRKTGQKTGVYKGKVEEQFHRYSRPQETGNKTDVRWIRVGNGKISLKALSEDHLLNSSTWPFAISEIDFDSEKDGAVSASGLVPVTKKHGADIKIGNTVQWNIDYQQKGVGGDNSWRAHVHDEYMIQPQRYTYSFSIQPIKN